MINNVFAFECVFVFMCMGIIKGVICWKRGGEIEKYIYVERERWEGRKSGEDYESNGEEDNKY